MSKLSFKDANEDRPRVKDLVWRNEAAKRAERERKQRNRRQAMTPEKELDRVLHLALHAVHELTAGSASITDGKVLVGFFMGDLYCTREVPRHLETISEALAWVKEREEEARQEAERRAKEWVDSGWSVGPPKKEKP